jgi:hypothetical protein
MWIQKEDCNGQCTNPTWRNGCRDRTLDTNIPDNCVVKRLGGQMLDRQSEKASIRNYDAVVMPIAGHGEASKYPPITVADCRTSRFASTASQAAAE